MTPAQVAQQKIDFLPSPYQQEVLHFMEFLLQKSLDSAEKYSSERSLSALELAGDLVGCLDDGPGDLATNPKYLKDVMLRNNYWYKTL